MMNGSSGDARAAMLYCISQNFIFCFNFVFTLFYFILFRFVLFRFVSGRGDGLHKLEMEWSVHRTVSGYWVYHSAIAVNYR